MTFYDFKQESKKTGYPFSQFTDKGFLNCFVAEIPDKNNYVGIYFPNNYGGATLVRGWGKTKRITFHKTLEEIHA